MKNLLSSYADLLAELEATRLSWAKNDVNLAVTRVGRYERELRQLVEMGPEGRALLPPDKAGRAFLLATEISEILFASRVTLDRDYLVHAPRISEIFNGPDFAADERDAGNRPRNTLFELTIAAAIELAGMR